MLISIRPAMRLDRSGVNGAVAVLLGVLMWKNLINAASAVLAIVLVVFGTRSGRS
ncbi:hypothetical protein [Kribbella qitaiheensis]|uniref:hypothetical protein n=1 Tax=Kribbella qitaiheensis TaxID=1544730 RepID=UPI0016233E96|nr:hypothetical protein [Kribbella qitaiheensis]